MRKVMYEAAKRRALARKNPSLRRTVGYPSPEEHITVTLYAFRIETR